ncbi:DUF1294 domain-containing protein [Lactococcus sp. dk322]|nr:MULTISPECIES: DUF1294 domain-containing protein [unclassified Lactococcus]MQW22494.1 DUF1294 domain-containing protein [Lactococcus sp. dk101]TXK45687.1 DUF1294 domain-containing protein [Lactococcus sp. dk310]TXK51527.1 DUF1294 domain-containing protein [Lactococcus sp. dk322]
MKAILLVLLLMYNLVSFIFYAVDKSKAKRHLWRIPEKVLLFLAIVGGGFGAFLGGQICHHKTRKWYFWLAWLVGLVIDFVLIFWILKM